MRGGLQQDAVAATAAVSDGGEVKATDYMKQQQAYLLDAR
jgi:hypothetical protein